MSRIAALIMGVTACFALEWARRGTQALLERAVQPRVRGDAAKRSPYAVLGVVWAAWAVLAMWVSQR